MVVPRAFREESGALEVGRDEKGTAIPGRQRAASTGSCALATPLRLPDRA